MEHFSSQPNRESEEIDDSRQLKNITADSGVLDINPESSTSVGPISNIPDFSTLFLPISIYINTRSSSAVSNKN